MNYIIKYLQDNQEKYKPVESKAELEKIKDGLNVVEIRENEQSFESFMEDSAKQGIIYPNSHEQYFCNSKKTSVDDFDEKNHSASCRRFFRPKIILPILVLACIIGGVVIVYSKQKKDARNARAQTRAVQAAGFDITGTYTRKEIHEITDAINHGNGNITMDEFNNILSRKTREKMCSNGDINAFSGLAGFGGAVSTRSANSSSKPESAVFRNAQSVLPYLIGKEFRSKDGSMRVRVSTQGISFNGKPLTNAPVVDYVERSYAVIHAYSPIRNATYRLGVYPQDGYIVDLNDDNVYYCR